MSSSDLIKTEEMSDHFLVGKHVQFGSEEGTIEKVIEHSTEDDNAERFTHTRVVVDLGDRQINVSSCDVEVLAG